MSIRDTCVLALLVASTSACIDDAAAWIPTELEVSQTLSQVGEESMQLVCDGFERSVHRAYRSPLLIKAACTMHALHQASDAEECGAIADECLRTLPAVVDEQLDKILAQAGCGKLDTGGCPATVSDLIECLADFGDAVEGFTLELTCAAFGAPVPPDWWKVAPPDSCRDLFSRCQSGE